MKITFEIRNLQANTTTTSDVSRYKLVLEATGNKTEIYDLEEKLSNLYEERQTDVKKWRKTNE